MALLQAVVIGLLALIITPGYLFYFDVTPKVVILLGGVAVALLLRAASGMRERAVTASDRGPRPVPRWFSILLLLNFISLALSTALSAHPALSAFGTNWRRFGAIVQAAILLFAWLVAVFTIGRPSRIRVILRGIAVASSISAIYGIVQYFGWDPILPAAAYHVGEGIWTIVRPPGTLGYVSYFATWLLFGAYLSVALASMEGRSIWRSIAFSAAGLSVVAMLLTGTRAAILGLVVGAAVSFVGRARTQRNDTRKNARVAALTVVTILSAVLVFYFSPAGLQLRSRARWFAEDRWGGNRLNLWRDSLRMGAARLLLGYGPEVFTAAFPPFESKALAQAYPDFAHESPHNIFLDALISQGLPGFLILCALCVLPLRRRPDSAAQNWTRAALVAGIVSQQFTVFTMPTALIFYTTIALAIGLSRHADEAPAAITPLRRGRSTLAAVPVAFALIYLASRMIIADHALERVRHSVDSGDLPSAVTHYLQYQRWRLPGTTSDLWYSRALLGLARKTADPVQRFRAVAESGAAAIRATQAAEDPFNAWYNMATLYASQNDARGTEQSLRAAIAAKPNWFKPHWTLAQVLRLENRMDEAEREAMLAAELNAGKNPEITQTLSEIRVQRARTPSEH